jgi:hypothetical protein
LTEAGASLWLAGLNPNVLGYVQSSGFADELGPGRIFHSAELALQAYLENR